MVLFFYLSKLTKYGKSLYLFAVILIILKQDSLRRTFFLIFPIFFPYLLYQVIFAFGQASHTYSVNYYKIDYLKSIKWDIFEFWSLL